jgi:hypothetical protein
MQKRGGLSKASVTGRQLLLDRHTAIARLDQGHPTSSSRSALASCKPDFSFLT